MRVKRDYIAKLKQFEGLHLTAYKPRGEKATALLTIGYGHYGAKAGETITEEQAHGLLLKDVSKVELQLSSINLPPLSLSRWSALVDFVYNVGFEAFRKSTLYRLIQHNQDDPRITHEFKRWIYSGGKALKGLQRRRAYEVKLWISDTDFEIV